MRYWLMCVIVLWMATPLFAQEGDKSCLVGFDKLDTIHLEGDKLEGWLFANSVHWYNDCFLINTGEQLMLYDPVRDESVQLVTSPTGQITHVAIRPSDNAIAFVSVPHNTVYLIDPFNDLQAITSEYDTVVSMAFSADGERLALASSNMAIYETAYFPKESLIQVFNRAGDEIMMSTHVRDWIVYLAFSADQTHLLTTSTWGMTVGNETVVYMDLDNDLNVWNSYELVNLSQSWSYEIDNMMPIHTVFSGRLLAIYGHEGYMDYDEFYARGIHIWDVERQERIHRFWMGGSYFDETARDLIDMAVSPDETMLVTIQTGGLIRVWSMIGGQMISEIDLQTSNKIYQITFNREGDQFAVANLDSAVIFDAQTLEIIAEYDLPDFTYTND